MTTRDPHDVGDRRRPRPLAAPPRRRGRPPSRRNSRSHAHHVSNRSPCSMERHTDVGRHRRTRSAPRYSMTVGRARHGIGPQAGSLGVRPPARRAPPLDVGHRHRRGERRRLRRPRGRPGARSPGARPAPRSCRTPPPAGGPFVGHRGTVHSVCKAVPTPPAAPRALDGKEANMAGTTTAGGSSAARSRSPSPVPQAGRRRRAPGHAHRLRHPRGAHRRRRRGGPDPGGRLGGQQRPGPPRHPAGRHRGHGPSRGGRGTGLDPGPGGGGHAVDELPRVGGGHAPQRGHARPGRRRGRQARRGPGPGAHGRGPRGRPRSRSWAIWGSPPSRCTPWAAIKVQAKQAAAADALVDDAKALAAAGCFAIVLEGVPDVVAARVTDEVDVPTIGIGAGVGCDGQVLVFHDLLGLGVGPAPKFVRRYADLASGRRGGGLGLGRRRALRGLPVRRRDLPPARRRRAPGDADPPVGYHGRWSRTGSSTRAGLPTEPCSARGRSPAAEWPGSRGR